MKTAAFILMICVAVGANSACQHAHPGGYEAPSKNSNGQLEEDVTIKIDSSVEKAVAHDTVKRNYKL
jgi:hypothetical protein